MKEDFLHYVWKFQKFNKSDLITTSGSTLKVITPGSHNHNSGPAFFNSKISVAGQLWAGNVEVHLKASDWYAHNHHHDPAFGNVILHVVWEHDADVFRSDNSVIPTVALKSVIKADTLSGYYHLFSEKNNWINCERNFASIDRFALENWLECLFFERLERKQELIINELNSLKNDWEALLFRLLCTNFGVKVNSDSFLSISQSMDFTIVKKCSRHKLELEALLLGQAGILSKELDDDYFNDLKSHYGFLRRKFNLHNDSIVPPKFFRLRPSSFPTLRLSQLAHLYAKRKRLFSEIIEFKELADFYELFDISASEYWDTHYNFGTSSRFSKKRLNKKFIHLIILNTVIPIKFCYAKYLGKDSIEELIHLARSIPKEENSLIKGFKGIGFSATHAMHSQALIQLKTEYCDKNRCLQCGIGARILKG